MKVNSKKKEIKLLGLSIGEIANILVAFTAIVALVFSAYQYKQGLKMQAKIDRPILSISKTGMGYDTTLTGHSIQINSIMENFGSRPAFDVTLNSITVKKDSSDNGFKVISSLSLKEANPIVPGVEFELSRKPLVYEDSTLYYFKVLVSYKDVISEIYYSDSLYYKWMYEGFPYSIFNSQLLGVEKKEADSLDNYLKKINFKYYTN